MLVHAQIAHVPQVSGQRCPDEEEHASNVTAYACFVKLLRAGFDEWGIVVWRVEDSLPLIVTLQIVELYSCCFPIGMIDRLSGLSQYL